MNVTSITKLTSALKSLFLILFVSVTSLFLFEGCKDKSDSSNTVTLPASNERGRLVSYTKAGSMSANEITSIGTEEGDVSNYTKHDLDIYSVVYNSPHQGQILQVSGLVFIPKNVTADLGLVQHHHGTIIPQYGDSETPSTYTGGHKGSSEMYFIGAVVASNGSVVSMPDYVGYGTTKDLEHPYTIHNELAEVSVDMLRATQQLMGELSINFNNKIFLSGWSEGGGAALATHKQLQTMYAGEMNVMASSLFAGPYDYVAFMKDIMNKRNTPDDELSIYSWSLYSLNKYNAELRRETNKIWSYSVNNQNDALNVPSLKAGEIFQTQFMDEFLNENDSLFVSAANANSLIKDWIPEGNLYFHSGTNDLIVPHYNSVNAHQHFESINVNSTLYEYPGEDHYTPLYKYVTRTIDDFNQL